MHTRPAPPRLGRLGTLPTYIRGRVPSSRPSHPPVPQAAGRPPTRSLARQRTNERTNDDADYNAPGSITLVPTTNDITGPWCRASNRRQYTASIVGNIAHVVRSFRLRSGSHHRPQRLSKPNCAYLPIQSIHAVSAPRAPRTRSPSSANDHPLTIQHPATIVCPTPRSASIYDSMRCDSPPFVASPRFDADRWRVTGGRHRAQHPSTHAPSRA